MSNTITIIENQWRVYWDGTQYMLEKYDAGGNEYRSPKTGSIEVSSPKWKHTGQYYSSIRSAVMEVVKQEASSKSKDLKEFLTSYENMSKMLLESIGDR